MKKKLVFIFLGVVMVSFEAVAGTVAGFGGSTEITQIANNVQLAGSYVEQAQQTVTQMNQYAAMLKNLQQLTPNSALSAASQQLWRNQNMNQSFKNLFTIVNSGQRIAYGSQVLAQRVQSMGRSSGSGLGSFNFQKAYRDWSDTTQNVLQSSLQNTAVHAESMDTEEDMVNELNRISQSPEGQLQAISAGNQIGIAMVGQMQKLRQLQINQSNAYAMTELTKSQEQDATRDLAVGAMGGGCTRVRTISEIKSKASCQ